MIILDVHVFRVAIVPHEADAVCLVDPDSVLTGFIVLEFFELVARATEVMQRLGRVKVLQMPICHALERLKAPYHALII